MYTQKFHEVQNTILESNHGLIDYMIVVNTAWWDKLPADVRQGLFKAMNDSVKFGNQLALDASNDYRKRIVDAKKAEVVKLNATELSAWRQAMKPVWSQFAGEIGQDLLDAAQQANKQ
jgi:C4-dicarboxylate-binding protein DctP